MKEAVKSLKCHNSVLINLILLKCKFAVDMDQLLKNTTRLKKTFQTQ